MITLRLLTNCIRPHTLLCEHATRQNHLATLTKSMNANTSHISICICTFRRPNLLQRLLKKLENMDTQGLFTYSVVVADNDRMQSAMQVVSDFAAISSVPVVYCVEPEQNIALARNKAIKNVEGDFIAFIDDDEFPNEAWLCNLFNTWKSYKADGVLGPVDPYFESEPARWVKQGGFFERPRYSTGYKLNWPETRTGNVLFRRSILNGIDKAFSSEFGTGSEDVDFFRRMMEQGREFIWCNEAIVYEVVPPARCTCRYLLRLALLRGSNSVKHPVHRIRNLAKSVVAIPVYTLALPILMVLGRHVFMKYLIKSLDHTGRVLAYLGWRVVKERNM
jgi:succinoglycan biosynthesis protein ExoM